MNILPQSATPLSFHISDKILVILKTLLSLGARGAEVSGSGIIRGPHNKIWLYLIVWINIEFKVFTTNVFLPFATNFFIVDESTILFIQINCAITSHPLFIVSRFCLHILKYPDRHRKIRIKKLDELVLISNTPIN